MHKYFISYTKLDEFFCKGRKLDSGRKINVVFRVKKNTVSDGYIIEACGKPFMAFSPDNKVTFVLPVNQIRNYAQSIVSTLSRHFPFVLQRVGVGRYKVAYSRDRYSATNFVDYSLGVAFDLDINEWSNVQAPPKERMIPEVRTQWLRDVKTWKNGIKTRHKMGVFTGIKDKLTKEQLHYNVMYGEEFCKRVTHAIRTNTFDHDLMEHFVKRTIRWAFRADHITSEYILDEIQSYLKTHSYDLRCEYGVFGDT